VDHLRATLALHLIGVLIWIGATYSAGALAAMTTEDEAPAMATKLGSLMRKFAVPGMILAWIGGLGRLMPEFAGVYARAGWMHTKLLLVLIISGLTGMMGAKLRRAAAGEGDLSAPRKLGYTVIALATVVVVLAVVKPG